MGQRSDHASVVIPACQSICKSNRADILTRNRVGRLDVGDVLSHDHGKAGLQVEVNVAVEEPRARVVSLYNC